MKINDFDNEEKLVKLIKDSRNENTGELDYFKDIKYIEYDYNKMVHHRIFLRYKSMSIVASIALIIIISSVLAILIANNTVSASMFNLEQSFIKLKNDVTGDNNGSLNVKGDSIIQEIKNIDDINKGVEFFPHLFTSDNIPERFIFQSLTITKTVGDIFNANYVYKDNKNQLLTICQQTIPGEGLSVSQVGITDEIKTKEGIIYLSENPFGDGGSSATYESQDYYIYVAGNIDKSEIIKMLDQY